MMGGRRGVVGFASRSTTLSSNASAFSTSMGLRHESSQLSSYALLVGVGGSCMHLVSTASNVEPVKEGARLRVVRTELARDKLGSCDRSGTEALGDTFLDRHFRVKDGILDPKREVRPSIGLRGALSARRLLARGFGANSLSNVSSSKSYAEEKCGPPTRLRIHSCSGISGKASSVLGD